MSMRVIDASDLILGRMASIVAKRLLNGEEIRIINAEKAVISGRKDVTIDKYKARIQRGSREKGPYFPKRPDRIVKRTIRGMIPYKKAKGRQAFKKLKVYIGVPPELSQEKAETIEDANIKRISTSNYIILGELSRRLGSTY